MEYWLKHKGMNILHLFQDPNKIYDTIIKNIQYFMSNNEFDENLTDNNNYI